jgi:DNA-binding MarR family transcriptional regulator
MNTPKDLFLMQQIYATLFSLANKLQVKGDQYLGSITSRQLMTIIAIFHLPEEQTTINNIARKLGTTKQSAKQLITVLEKKGYIITVPSLMDKRAINVKVTDAWKKIGIECGEKSVHFFVDLFNDFSTDEMESLWKLLKKLYCFDGEEQDGFEEEPEFDLDEKQKEAQIRALNDFSKRRKENHG